MIVRDHIGPSTLNFESNVQGVLRRVYVTQSAKLILRSRASGTRCEIRIEKENLNIQLQMFYWHMSKLKYCRPLPRRR